MREFLLFPVSRDERAKLYDRAPLVSLFYATITMNMTYTNDAWKQLFGAAPFLLLIGIIIVIYLTAFTALFAHFLGATTQSSTSASEEVLAELRDICQSHSLSEHVLRQRLSSLDKQDDSYHILLFDICGNEHVTPGILKCFIEYFPRAVRCADSRGLTPLHLVLLNKNCTVDIVRCLTEAFSDDLLEVLRLQNEGFTPLAILCLNRKLDQIEAVKILRLFMEKCPECAQCRMDGILPIGVAVRRRRSHEFCCVLVDAFPESMIRREDEGVEGVPLLVSVLQSPDMDDRIASALLTVLLKNHLEMIRRFRWNARSVLHLVAQETIPRSVELCRLLIVALPELVCDLAKLRTGAQFMPLHTACCHGNLPIVKCILDIALMQFTVHATTARFACFRFTVRLKHCLTMRLNLSKW